MHVDNHVSYCSYTTRRSDAGAQGCDGVSSPVSRCQLMRCSSRVDAEERERRGGGLPSFREDDDTVAWINLTNSCKLLTHSRESNLNSIGIIPPPHVNHTVWFLYVEKWCFNNVETMCAMQDVSYSCHRDSLEAHISATVSFFRKCAAVSRRAERDSLLLHVLTLK